MENIGHILISRTDSIGDVVLTLPLAGILKQEIPDARITFLAQAYTRPVIECSANVDEVLDLKFLASTGKLESTLKSKNVDAVILAFPDKEVTVACKKAGIPVRIATGRRWHTFASCNRLVWFSRKKSDLHEAQLNVKLLEGLGLKLSPSLAELNGYLNLSTKHPIPSWLRAELDAQDSIVIIHPKSKGSAHDWATASWVKLINELPLTCKVVLTGTADEQEEIKLDLQAVNREVLNTMGRLSLPELIALIDRCHVLMAASTGPLHIASALGKNVIGLYPEIRPMHPGRWKPLGKNVHVLSTDQIDASHHLDIPVPKVLALLLEILESRQ